jgi:HlyD family secretion protein
MTGLLISAFSIGTFGAGASVATIHGAVAAPGTVIVESWPKKIQHNEGGIVADILVDNGSEVREGDVLVRLDDTQARAKLVSAQKQLVLLNAQATRLRAERDDLPEPRFSAPNSDEEADAITTERSLFHARRLSIATQQDQGRQRALEKEKEIDDLEADLRSIDELNGIASKEHADLKDLLDRKYVTVVRVYQLEREIAALRGRRSQRTADIAKRRAEIEEIKFHISQIEADDKKDALSTLTATETKIADLVQQRVLAEDFLNRIEIKAPQSGVVHNRAIHTKGEIVRPADVLMIVVPKGDRLVIEARVAPQDIDQVAVGQAATVRFTNFNRPTTPELSARVTRVSADVEIDQPQSWPPRAAPINSQAPYYAIRIEIPDEELKKLDGGALVPGMQVETFVATSDRTVISYLIKPVVDRLARSMRER